MFTYGQIIEYIDGTYDENFDNAYQWCKDNIAGGVRLQYLRMEK